MDLSLIVVNYNYADYLPDTLESIVRQTVLPEEVLLCDDGSTDESPSIMRDYAKKYPFFRLVLGKENLGLFAVVNRVVSLAQGKYVSFIASDDIYLPQFLKKHRKAMSLFPNYGIYCSEFAFFKNRDLHEIQQTHTRTFCPETVTPLQGETLIRAMRSKKFWIPSPCIVRKDLFMKYGYETSVGEYCDFFLYAAVAFEAGACHTPEILTAVRNHDRQFSRNIDLVKRKRSWKNLLKKLSYPPFRPHRKAFRKSHLFYLFGIDFLPFILKHPYFWRHIDATLWRKMLRSRKRLSEKNG